MNNFEIIFMKSACILFSGMLLISCEKKNDPIEVIEEPVFRVSGTMNGQPLNISAGVDDYVMYTDYNFDNSTSVYEFNGSIRKFNCAHCPQSLNIRMRNYRQSGIDEGVFADSAFTENYYSISSVVAPSVNFLMQFNHQSNGVLQQGKWFFGDGSLPVMAADTQHIYVHPGEYTVGFIGYFGNGCTDTLVNTFRFGIKGSNCHANFSPTILGDSVSLLDYSSGTAPLNYFFDFGDGVTSNQWLPYHVYSHPGVYTILLRVEDAENSVSEFKRKVFVLPTTACMAGFQFPQLSGLPNTFNLSTISIEYIDANGTIFSSDFNPGSNDGFFRIDNVEDYGNNSHGDKVKKLKIQFSCRLYNSTQTENIDLDISDAIFAVAYK